MTSNENMPTNNFETTSDSKETSKLKQASSGETIQPTKTTTTKPANSRWSKLRESIEQQVQFIIHTISRKMKVNNAASH